MGKNLKDKTKIVKQRSSSRLQQSNVTKRVTKGGVETKKVSVKRKMTLDLGQPEPLPKQKKLNKAKIVDELPQRGQQQQVNNNATVSSLVQQTEPIVGSAKSLINSIKKKKGKITSDRDKTCNEKNAGEPPTVFERLYEKVQQNRLNKGEDIDDSNDNRKSRSTGKKTEGDKSQLKRGNKVATTLFSDAAEGAQSEGRRVTTSRIEGPEGIIVNVDLHAQEEGEFGDDNSLSGIHPLEESMAQDDNESNFSSDEEEYLTEGENSSGSEGDNENEEENKRSSERDKSFSQKELDEMKQDPRVQMIIKQMIGKTVGDDSKGSKGKTMTLTRK